MTDDELRALVTAEPWIEEMEPLRAIITSLLDRFAAAERELDEARTERRLAEHHQWHDVASAGAERDATIARAEAAEKTVQAARVLSTAAFAACSWHARPISCGDCIVKDGEHEPDCGAEADYRAFVAARDAFAAMDAVRGKP